MDDAVDEPDQAELDRLCRGPEQRLREAMAASGSAAAVECSRSMTALVHDIAALYSNWCTATTLWLAERHGFAAAAAAFPSAELLPAGPVTVLTAEQLEIVRAVYRAPDHSTLAEEFWDRVRASAEDGADTLVATWDDVHHALDGAEILRRDSATALVSLVHDRYGPDGLEDCLRFATDLVWAPRMAADLGRPPVIRLRAWAEKMSVGHNGAVRIRSESDCWVFVLDPCGSCGRQILGGRYRSPWNFGVVEPGHRVGFFRDDITVYQSHLAVAHTLVPIERTGAPWPAMRCAGLAAQPCELVLYKVPAATPAEFYRQVGLEPDRGVSAGSSRRPH